MVEVIAETSSSDRVNEVTQWNIPLSCSFCFGTFCCPPPPPQLMVTIDDTDVTLPLFMSSLSLSLFLKNTHIIVGVEPWR